MSHTVEINVHGSGEALRPAERALVHLEASAPQFPSQKEASIVVTATANAIRDMIAPFCPLEEETRRTMPDAPIVHYSMSTLSTSENPGRRTTDADRNSIRSDTTYTARAAFTIKFQDFGVLNTVATKLSAMDHVRISNIEWLLTDATRDDILEGARKKAARDAIKKARDHAEVFTGVPVDELREDELRKRVRPVCVNESSYYQQSTKPQLHYGKGQRGIRGSAEELQFEPEDVRLSVQVDAKFVVEL